MLFTPGQPGYAEVDAAEAALLVNEDTVLEDPVIVADVDAGVDPIELEVPAVMVIVVVDGQVVLELVNDRPLKVAEVGIDEEDAIDVPVEDVLDDGMVIGLEDDSETDEDDDEAWDVVEMTPELEPTGLCALLKPVTTLLSPAETRPLAVLLRVQML